MRRRVHLITPIVVLVALGLVPAAAGHGGGAAKGYRSTIVSITPRTSALDLAVLDSDDRMQLRLQGQSRVVIHGYEGEPYLRFGPDGVYRNARSPATYLNDDRYGKAKLPTVADPEAPPDWEQVAAAGRAYAWHDHRIHWMSPTYPPRVEADKEIPHHIFNWTVPGTIDGKPLAIRGSLDYEPLPGSSFPKILIVPLVAIAAAGAAAVWLRRRRTRAM
jgi:hypothetical protein